MRKKIIKKRSNKILFGEKQNIYLRRKYLLLRIMVIFIGGKMNKYKPREQIRTGCGNNSHEKKKILKASI
jgi:hypothetical protein